MVDPSQPFSYIFLSQIPSGLDGAASLYEQVFEQVGNEVPVAWALSTSYCNTCRISCQELQSALHLLAVLEPMMEAAGRRDLNSGGLNPMLCSCPNLVGLKQEILAVSRAAARCVIFEIFLARMRLPDSGLDHVKFPG